ncbi:MAG: OmpW family protein [Nitrosomonadales bacterium]|nr:OmpW family protein [Nitrosomonadales bacterium]
MKYLMKNALIAGMVAVSMVVSAAAFAQGWSIAAGINKVSPKVQSGDLSAPALPGTKVGVDSDTRPIVSLSYAYNEHIAVDLVLGAPYTHTLYGDGSIAGVGNLGQVDALPPTIFGQYHFLDAQSKWRPYVGLGLTYAYFRNATGSGALTALTNTGSTTPTTFSVNSAWGITPEIGVVYEMQDNWFADLTVVKSYLKTQAIFSTGQTIDVTLNPVSTSVALGRHF